LNEVLFTMAVQRNTTKKRITHSSKGVIMSKMRANKWRFSWSHYWIARKLVCVLGGEVISRKLDTVCSADSDSHSLSDLKDVCWRLIVIATKYLVIYLATPFIFKIVSKWIVVDPESHGEFRETNGTQIRRFQSLFSVKTNNQGIQGNHQQLPLVKFL
jgi:hypothetical protein